MSEDNDTGDSGFFERLEVDPGKKASVDALAELHQLVAKALSGRISAGVWSSGDIAAATKFLKDNNITADAADNQDLQELREALENKQAARAAARKSHTMDPDELAKIAMDEISKDMGQDVWH